LQPKRVRWPKERLSEPVRLRIDVRGAYRVDLQSAIPSFSILKSRWHDCVPGSGAKMRCTAHCREKDVLYRFERIDISHPWFKGGDLARAGLPLDSCFSEEALRNEVFWGRPVTLPGP
jgi:hypothetical protein